MAIQTSRASPEVLRGLHGAHLPDASQTALPFLSGQIQRGRRNDLLRQQNDIVQRSVQIISL